MYLCHFFFFFAVSFYVNNCFSLFLLSFFAVWRTLEHHIKDAVISSMRVQLVFALRCLLIGGFYCLAPTWRLLEAVEMGVK